MDLSMQTLNDYMKFRNISDHYFSQKFIGRPINSNEIGY